MNVPLRLTRLAISFSVLGMLSACGGGGDTPTAPPPPPPVGSITLTGVVARGAALANASVAVTCATGAGTATTAATGAYSVAITGGALPCVLRATSSDSALRLHSVAPAGSATSVTANVTPLTELVVARLSGAEPTAFVASANASILTTTATASAVAAAQASVAGTLLAGGVNTSTAGDFISGALVAASPGATPNAYDRVLDALSAQLTTAGTTLAALTTTIASGSPAAPANPSNPGAADVPSLPADLLLKAKASNCASLVSTSYRLIKFAPSPGSTVTAVDTVDFNAASLTLRLPGTTTVVDTFTPNGNCRYSNAAGADIVISPAGVLVARATLGATDDSVAASARGTRRMIIGLPVQNIAPAELAGSWNAIGWERDGSAVVFDEVGGIATVGSSGAITSFRCGSLLTAIGACVADTSPLPVFSVNSAGGLNLTSTDPTDPFVDRAFAYRAGNGELMTVLLAPNGGLLILTKERTLTLPAVGAVSSSWNLDVDTAGVASTAFYARTNTVTSVSGSTLVRNTSNDASTVTAPQTLQFNQARNGYVYRPGATVTASDGSSRAVRELFSLQLRGFGLTPYYAPPTTGTGASPALFGMSVTKQP